jgi:hypothetical protein
MCDHLPSCDVLVARRVVYLREVELFVMIVAFLFFLNLSAELDVMLQAREKE